MDFLGDSKGSLSTTSRLVPGCRWSDARFLVHVMKLHFTAITLNQKSNFTRREKNHLLFRSDTLMYPELLIRIWMSSKSAASMINGTSMGQEICLIFGQVSLNLLCWMRNLQTDFCGSVRRLTRKQLTSRPDHLWPELWRGMSKNAKLREKQKWATEKPKLDNGRKIKWNLLHWSWWWGIQGHYEECS